MEKTQKNYEYFNKCPICAYTALRTFRKSTFDLDLLTRERIKITDADYGKTWSLSLCEKCGYVFANPCPSADLIRSLYSGIIDPLYEEEAQGRSKNFIPILSFLEKIHPEKGPLFDVGAATGILLNLARNRGWETDGIEASSWAVELAAQKYNLNIRKGNFESASLKSNYYKAVTMVDIIEHVSHPFEAVVKTYEILAPGGILCIVTPDIKSITAKITDGKWWHFRPAHIGYYSLKSLSFLLHRTGFKIIKIRKYNWTFSANYIISRISGLKYLLKNTELASFCKRIPIKLVLGDSLEIYTRKDLQR